MPENNGDRLDRIERILENVAQRQDRAERESARRQEEHDRRHVELNEEFARRQAEHDRRQEEIDEEFRRLLTAQVLIADAQRRTDEKLAEVTEKLTEVTEKITEVGEKLNALIAVVDGVIRKPPPQPPTGS